MYVKEEFDFNDLMDRCWSGAINTLETIEANGKEEELMQLLEDYAEAGSYDMPTLTEINDLLRFEDGWIFEMLNIETEE